MLIRRSATSLDVLAFALATALAAAAAAAAAPAAAQQVIVVRQGTTDTAAKTVGGTDSITVEAGGTLSTASNPTITWSTGSTDLRITNAGTIRSTASGGQAINASGGNNARSVTLVNTAGGLIESADDAFRINVAPTSGTIRVDNYGIIRTTGGGQALDFDAIAANATVVINNFTGGELRSIGQDAIRPGQGATVTNAGLIFSDGAANNSYDGIDWQGRSGVVVNQASGTISGLRHGITSDVAVTVTNAGTILGRNGSGVGSDGTGTVTNTGTITGRWDGVATNGDGDGVDIDFIGSVTNSGTIQGLSAAGVDSGGRPNSAEGIAMGGGTIVNTAGALVFGAGNAILVNHDTNPGGVADGATTITNAGTIRAGTGRAVQLVGAFADTITNSGTITGGAGGAIDMGDGNDTLNLQTGSVITGTVDGGAGTDRITLGGTGAGTLGATTGFETLAVTGGSWTLSAASSYANGVSVAAGATLTGSSATLANPTAIAGTLVVDQATDGTFAAALSGSGQFVKAGTGTLRIRDQTGFTGRIGLNAGRLVLAGALPAAVTVASGATLAGTGTVASLSVAAGGTVAPGTSPGTISVSGAFAQAAGSTYAAETTAAGASDLVAVGGTATIAGGATLAVTRDTGTYAIGSRYTLLTAAGGISGTYTLSQTTTGGTEFRLVQSANAIGVVLARSGASLTPLAQTPNQRAAASAVAALGAVNPLYAALTLVADDTAVRNGLNGLSGEIHATQRLTMVRAASAGEDAVRSRLYEPASSGVWGQAIGTGGDDQGDTDTAATKRHGWGAFGGADLALADARLGIAGGYTHADLTLPARASTARVESRQVLGYAGGLLGPARLRTIVGYAWTRTATARSVAVPGFAGRASARYHGDVLHGAVEAGIPRAMMGGIVEPFASIELYRVRTDAFAEGASAIALAGRRTSETFSLATLGVRGQTPIVEGLGARSRLGWQHALGDTRPDALLQFVGGTLPFAVQGAPLSRDSAAVTLDLVWQPVGRLTITSGYAGSIGGSGDDSRLRVSVSLAF